jgi:DNA-directed RNA polymerase specialized sigma subunit
MYKHCRYKLLEIEKELLKDMLKENEKDTIYIKSLTRGKLTIHTLETIKELDNKINSSLEKVEQEQAQIKKLINGIENEDTRKIFYLKYIEGKTWEQIANIVYYSPSYLMRIFKEMCKSREIADIKTFVE